MAGVAHVDRRQNVRGAVEGGQAARAGKGAGETYSTVGMPSAYSTLLVAAIVDAVYGGSSRLPLLCQFVAKFRFSA